MGGHGGFAGGLDRGVGTMTAQMTFAPVGQLSPQPWLNSAETKAVLDALTADGAEVRFIGGCVRDAIARRPVKDIDLATPTPPDRVMALLEAAGLRAVPTGLAHGTITAIGPQGTPYEVTTLRRDVATDGRHATVAFTDDWYADAARRDFTINALSADREGQVYDYFNGLQDLGAGRIRFIGLAAQRLDEDILRLLRFFRFAAFYGMGNDLDRSALDACRVAAPRLSTLSGERIAQELLRLLEAPDPAAMLTIMQGLGILAPILPDVSCIDRLKILQWLETRAMARSTVRPDVLRRLASTLRPGMDDYSLPGRLHLSNAQTDRLLALTSLPRPNRQTAAKDLRRMLYQHGADTVRDLILLAWADERTVGILPGAEENQRWIALLDTADQWQPHSLPVSGADCLACGMKQGPQCGAALAKVEHWWIEADFKPDRAACLSYLRQLVDESLPPDVA